MKRKGSIFILSIMLFILTYLICSQIKTITSSESDILQLQREDALRDEVLKWKNSYNNVNDNLDETQKKLNQYITNATQIDETANLIQKELQEVNVIAGITDVKGPGITITLKDAATLDPNFLAEDQIVHDTDIMQVVNELRVTGAEAISINGQRITAKTAIRCVGTTIMINDIKVGAPFVIKAIGNVDYLYSGMNMLGGIVDKLKRYGIQVEAKQENNIEIPKYEGAIKMQYATENIEEE